MFSALIEEEDMDKRFDIIGLENGIVDLALQLDEIPQPGSASNLRNFLWTPGGNVDNAIAAAARQGARCAFMGTVGSDMQGDFFRRDLAMHGIDASHLLTKQGSTTIAVCLAEEKTRERSFLVYRGPDGNVPDLEEDELDEDFIAESRYLHVGGSSGKMMRRAVAVAREKGVIVSVDGASLTEDLAWVLDHCDIMIMSKQYYHQLFPEDDNYVKNMEKLERERQLDTCIVTLGPDGCAGANSKGETFRIPAFSGYDIADTTGAGDVFHGGFLFAHSQGWDLETCARYASAVSFIKCTVIGGRVGIPDRGMVERFLKDGTIRHSDLAGRIEHYRSVMSLN